MPASRIFDVRVFERGQHLVEVAARLVGGQAAQAVVAAEFDDHDLGVQAAGWSADRRRRPWWWRRWCPG
jgi:hypothetical protein